MTEENSGAKENGQGKQGKTWYPYITKSQFEKFILRLESKTPDLIDRDYVRAIIRTPSMIHRFLRGIQAMQLIDRDQRPTERLQRLAAQKDRKSAMAEILQDLYPELLEKWQGSNGSMADGEIVDFFRQQTDMGKDSANKMKMFFKYLLTEAEGGEPAAAAEEAEETPEAEEPSKADADSAPSPESREPPAPSSGNGRRGEARAQTSDRRPQGRGGDRGDRERSERGERGERGDRERAERGERGERGERERDRERSVNSNRPLTEAQRAYLDTLKSVLRVNVDGDWDDDMIRLAFDRLERLFDRVRRN